MSTFRNRPKDGYIHEADWQDLYSLTEHWQSDLEFYSDDLKFLRGLIDRFFLYISKKENIDRVQEIEQSLLEMDKRAAALLEKTKKHLHHLAELIDNPFTYDSHAFRTEHEHLEDEIQTFVKDFRKNRRGVFKVTEYTIDAEETVRRLHLTS
ncbi:hypothetical protein [Pseudozobellia thermophila]|uniref:Uncharacterized protein n=1 Tax=Pseudozobellia thermophila TaxID=192903 RepID=A0A1M6GBY3_9FLAO|nr:hypothetical protein [Pseudozobellia thermophila]SHJ07417.1 hypothetical protein SAMN04488513_102755 [Pseudozobellia thermophila]